MQFNRTEQLVTFLEANSEECDRTEKSLSEMTVKESVSTQAAYDSRYAGSFAKSAKALATRVRRPRKMVTDELYAQYLSAIAIEQIADINGGF